MTILRRTLLILGVVGCAYALVTAEESPSKFEQAKALYAQGPSKAKEIVALLKEELASNPDFEPAVKLLGMTYFGTGRFQDALAQFDRVLDLESKRGGVAPQIVFLKARALNELGRCSEAKKLLEANSAFWQDDLELKAQYEQLYPDLKARCGSQ